MQLLDTLVIQQNYIPMGKFWVIKNQLIYPAGKFFFFDFFGNFLQVYNKFDLAPAFNKKHFGNTILKFYDSANKKSTDFWETNRPLTLSLEEKKDYNKKDSLELVRKDPHYLDSMDRVKNKFSISKALLWGYSVNRHLYKSSLSFQPIIQSIHYNSVEGVVLNLASSYSKKIADRKYFNVAGSFRYGASNKHFNPNITLDYRYGKKYTQHISLSGGSAIFQFNNQPLNQFQESLNTSYTLFDKQNFMKIYEATYFNLQYSKFINSGIEIHAGFQFQNRKPLENLSDINSWNDKKDRDFTPNYPIEVTNSPMLSNLASLVSIGIKWRPGSRYIELADKKISIGSKYPLFSASITKGINGLLGSEVDYTRWNLSVMGNLNFKLLGKLNYNFGGGGFLNASKTYIPDWQHFNGNQTFFGGTMLQTFQLARYYEFSNTASFHSSAHVEYHLNGLLTNKIPGFKKLNWFLVTGANMLHVNSGTSYNEYFLGLENIFKLLRVDMVWGKKDQEDVRSGMKLLIPILK